MECTTEDVHELQRLLELTTRPVVKAIIHSQIDELQRQCDRICENPTGPRPPVLHTEEPQLISLAGGAGAAASAPEPGFVTIEKFGWDQENNTVNVFVEIPGIHETPTDHINVHFGPQSLDLKITNHQGKNLRFHVKSLCKPVDPSGCRFKVKKNMIWVTLKKKEFGWWDSVAFKEGSVKKTPNKAADNSDPSASIMNLMRDLYNDGDDEMKKTIAKAWTEGQQRRTSGEDTLSDSSFAM